MEANKKSLVNNSENQRKALRSLLGVSPEVKSNLTSYWLRPDKQADFNY